MCTHPHGQSSSSGLLHYLEALTFDFDHADRKVSAILIYAQPDPAAEDLYHFVAAADTGYEGIACVDDTARAALLALGVYEQTGSSRALSLAKRWLTFVEYMQYSDGSFANFIRNAAGVRNASGPTSQKGGYWWSVRALWVLARAYRLTHNPEYLERFLACRLDPIPDGKINALQALCKLELYQAEPSIQLRADILHHCEEIITNSGDGYFRDHSETEKVNLWGYHQLHAVAQAAYLLDEPYLIPPCRRTVQELIAPDVAANMWYSFPDRNKNGVCAYNVTPIVQGLGALYRATGVQRYRQLALKGADWFYGRNDARAVMYDVDTGRCRDGISNGVASLNCGAESAIEAGLCELERQFLSDLL